MAPSQDLLQKEFAHFCINKRYITKRQYKSLLILQKKLQQFGIEQDFIGLLIQELGWSCNKISELLEQARPQLQRSVSPQSVDAQIANLIIHNPLKLDWQQLSTTERHNLVWADEIVARNLVPLSEVNRILRQHPVDLGRSLLQDGRLAMEQYICIQHSIQHCMLEERLRRVRIWSYRHKRDLQISFPPQLTNLEQYEILHELGRGGMGVVYAAMHRQLDRIVALKMLLETTEIDRKRFIREAKLAGSLNHPGIVTIYEIANSNDLLYFTMEYVAGISFEQYLANGSGRLEDKLRIVSEVAQALEVAHQAMIVHRDIKPANILLDSHGKVRITDFGLARDIRGGSTITISGVAVGTPHYMAPEQALGKLKAIDPRTDIYALGVVLYEALTGRRPFRHTNLAGLLIAITREKPLPPRQLAAELPETVEQIILKCLEKKQERRYQSAQELYTDLQTYLNSPHLAWRGEHYSRRLRKRILQHWYGAVLLLLAIYFLFSWQGARENIRQLYQLARAAERSCPGQALSIYRALVQEGSYPPAVDRLKLLEQQNQLLWRRALVYQRRGNAQQACRIYCQLLSRMPEAYQRLYHALQGLRTSLTQPSGGSPCHAPYQLDHSHRMPLSPLYEQAISMMTLPQNYRALQRFIALLNQAIQQQAHYAPAYFYRARAYEMLGRCQEAQENYRACLQLRPQWLPVAYYALKIGLLVPTKCPIFKTSYFVTYHAYSLSQKLDNQQSKAHKSWSKVLDLCCRAQKEGLQFFPEISLLKARAYFQLANYSEDDCQGCLGKALSELQRLPPSLSGIEGNWLWGRISLRLRDFAKAEECFTRILTLQPQHNAARWQRLQTRIAQGRCQAALEDLDTYIEQHHQHNTARILRGLIYLLQGNQRNAQADLLTSPPAQVNIELLFVQGLALLKLGRKDLCRNRLELMKKYLSSKLYRAWQLFLANSVTFRQISHVGRPVLKHYLRLFMIRPRAKIFLQLFANEFVRAVQKEKRLLTFSPALSWLLRQYVESMEQDPLLCKAYQQMLQEVYGCRVAPLELGYGLVYLSDIALEPLLAQTRHLPTASLYYRRAIYYYRTQQLRKAAADLRSYLNVYPDSLKGHYALATVLARLPQSHNEALHHLRQAIDLGWACPAYTASDPDFAQLSASARFKELLRENRRVCQQRCGSR